MSTAPLPSTPPAAASWSTRLFNLSPLPPVGSHPGPPASSSQLNRAGWEAGGDGQQDAQILAQRDRRRASLLALDRKRRGGPDTGSSTHVSSNPSVNSVRGHSHNSNTIDIHRPLPSLPAGGSSDDAPGVSLATAIDLLSSPVQPASPRPSQDPPPPPPPLRLPPRRQEDLMEYILPQWQPDIEVTHCPICHTQFSFWYRKHHCRKCGRVVCAACSPHRITIPRQYIVRPPLNPTGGPASMATPPRVGGSQVIDLTDDEPSSPSASYRPGDTAPNPALGGGEEVRLCNPCVPDPNPDPPLGYRAIRSGLDHLAGGDWASATSSFPPGQSLHRAHHTVSGGLGYGFSPDWERRRRGQSMLVCPP
jgi:FYVE-type zinc finger protein